MTDETEFSEIDENSSELEIVRHALCLALDIIANAEPAIDEEDIALLEFCERVHDASKAGDLTAVRREIAEAE